MLGIRPTPGLPTQVQTSRSAIGINRQKNSKRPIARATSPHCSLRAPNASRTRPTSTARGPPCGLRAPNASRTRPTFSARGPPSLRCGRTPDRATRPTVGLLIPGETFGRRVRRGRRPAPNAGVPRRRARRAGKPGISRDSQRPIRATLPSRPDFRTRDTPLGDAGTPHPRNVKPLACRKQSFSRHVSPRPYVC
jgi:hypothetical protein